MGQDETKQEGVVEAGGLTPCILCTQCGLNKIVVSVLLLPEWKKHAGAVTNKAA